MEERFLGTTHENDSKGTIEREHRVFTSMYVDRYGMSYKPKRTQQCNLIIYL